MAQPYRAHIYCRVSSTGQEDNTSLDTQEAACRRWCSERGLAIASVAREVWSGADRHRPELDAMLARVLQGDVVLAYALDRLSRSQIDTAILIDRLEGSGASLELVTEDFERSATGTFLRNAKAFVAELEREKIAERTQRGRRARVASGKPLAGRKAPYGYVWADAEKSHLVLDPEIAPIVRSIFDAALTGGTLRGIAASLTERGVPTPMGGSRWSAAGVRTVLLRSTYTGVHTAIQTRRERRPGGGYSQRRATAEERIALPGIAPAIVTPEEHTAVLARLDYNAANATRHNKYPELTLLRAGYIRCGHCGYALGVRNPSASRPMASATYLCVHHTCTHPGVTQPTIAANVIDPLVWRAVRSILSDPGIIEREVAARREDGDLERELADLDRRIEANASKQQRLARAVAALDDADAADALLVEMKLLATGKKALAEERAALEKRVADAESDRAKLAAFSDWCTRVAANLDRLSYDEKRLALQALGVAVRIHRPGATDEHGTPLDRWEITMRPVGAEDAFAFGSSP